MGLTWWGLQYRSHTLKGDPHYVRGAIGYENPLSRNLGLTRTVVGSCIEVSRHVRHSLPVHRFYSFSFSTVYRVWVSKDIFPQLYSIVYRYSALFIYSITVRFWHRVFWDSIYQIFRVPHSLTQIVYILFCSLGPRSHPVLGTSLSFFRSGFRGSRAVSARRSQLPRQVQ